MRRTAAIAAMIFATTLTMTAPPALAWEYYSGCIAVTPGDIGVGVNVTNFTSKPAVVKVEVLDCSVNPAKSLGDSGDITLEPDGIEGHAVGFPAPAGAQVQIHVSTPKQRIVVPSASIHSPSGAVDIRLTAGDFQRY